MKGEGRNLMTIIHDKWGEVDGASNYSVADRPSSMGKHFMGEKGTWEKNGAIYLDSNGWREKVEERWKDAKRRVRTNAQHLHPNL